MIKQGATLRGRAALDAAMGNKTGRARSAHTGDRGQAKGDGRGEGDYQQAIVDLALANRWEKYHTHRSDRSDKGWPDLVLYREQDARIIFAEVKGRDTKVTPEQKVVLGSLGRIAARREGVEVYLWRDGTTPWDEIERVLRYKPGRAHSQVVDGFAELDENGERVEQVADGYELVERRAMSTPTWTLRHEDGFAIATCLTRHEALAYLPISIRQAKREETK